MSWNYRVVKRYQDVVGGRGSKEYFYSIHEVFYNSNGDIVSISEEPAGPENESFEELRGEVTRMLDAMGKPVLDYDQIEFGEWIDGCLESAIENYDGHVKGTQCC